MIPLRPAVLLCLSALVCASGFALPSGRVTFETRNLGQATTSKGCTYTWDAENRLTAMQENTATLPAGWARQRLEFGYDAGSRRIRKTVKQWNGSAWQTTSDTAFVYDGWNLIAELDLLQAPGSMLRATYVWGLDVSQSSQGAGGVGGLLWATTYLPSPISHLPCYDGNGNIIGYVDAASGSPVLKLDYDPFGNPVMVASMNDAASSAAARAIPFRFSTKYTDRETGLSYYGYRYYRADLGRWLNPDPLGELGGVNLYGMVKNNVVGRLDYLGRDMIPAYLRPGVVFNTDNAAFYAVNSKGRLVKLNGLPESENAYDYIYTSTNWFQREMLGLVYNFQRIGYLELGLGAEAAAGVGEIAELTSEAMDNMLGFFGLNSYDLLAFGPAGGIPGEVEEALASLGNLRRLRAIVAELKLSKNECNTTENARSNLANILALRLRQLELGTDPVRGFIQAEGVGGIRIEQALGRAISRSKDVAVDFIDSQLGKISLKGPIPEQGSVQGLINAAIYDANLNTATRTLFIDTKGLVPADVKALKAAIRAGTGNSSKAIFFLE